MKKMMMTVAFGAAMVFLFGTSSASAQTTCPPHSNLGFEINECNPAGLAACTELCVCDRGYHLRDADQPVSSSNPCVRNVRGDRDGDGTLDIAGSVCIGDARERTVPGGFVVCECPDALDTEDRNGDGAPDHDADQDGIQETRRVRVDWDRSERRAMGVSMMGVIYDCMSASGLSTQTEIDAGATERRLALLEQQIRTICGTTDEATPEDVLEDCARFHEEALRGGVSSITIGDQTYTIGEFAERVMGRLAEIDATNERQDDDIDGLRSDVDGLLTRPDGGGVLQTFLSSMHLRIGAFGMVGGMLPGPATGAGGASLELLFRFGDLPVGAYGRLHFGGQSTGWNVGESMYLSGGAGFALFTGGREDTTIALGYYGETLVDPYVAGDAFPHDSVGVAHGAELSASLPIPGLSWLRIRGSIIGAFSERRLIDDQGVYMTPQAFSLAGTLGLEGQVP